MSQVLLISSASPATLNPEGSQDVNLKFTRSGDIGDALRKLHHSISTIDYVWLDWNLDGGHAETLLHTIKQMEAVRHIPVFVFGEADRHKAIELGAQDVLPRSLPELVARTRSTDKPAPVAGGAHQMKRGPFVFDLMSMRVHTLFEGRERPIELTRSEFVLLAHLASHPGRSFSRSQLLEELWGKSVKTSVRTVDVHICAIRRKLGEYGSRLKSDRRVGYSFVA